jgi:KDO2-lipid IV(A) lauroyltransferase
MTLLFRLLSRCPLWLLHVLGSGLGWLSFLLSPPYRRRLQANAAQAGVAPRDVRRAIGQAGRMTAELPRLWLGAPVPFFWDNPGPVEQAYAQGKGVIVLTPHMGCFEVIAQALAQHYAPQHGPLTVLYRPARQPWLAEVMAGARERPGLETAPANLSGVRQMIKALRKSHSVGLLPDQVPPEGMGLWSPFFGQPAYTMTLAARLAQQTGAVPVLVWGERLPWGRGFRLHVQAMPQTLSDDLPEAVAQINRAMEALILQHPSQYLWGYARYKQPRAEL